MPSDHTDLYGSAYRNFASDLYARIRAEAFGEDIGQTGWITAGEQDLFIAWLKLSPADRLLDVACGSGRPTLRIAQKSGCRVTGVDLHAEGIAAAKANAVASGRQAAQNSSKPTPPQDCPSQTAPSRRSPASTPSTTFPTARASSPNGAACLSPAAASSSPIRSC
jgi:SAM-dependent methyltransferase